MKITESINNKIIDKALGGVLPRQGKLAQAMRYSIFAGGKRLRPMLCLAAAKAVGKKWGNVIPFACAVEMVHTFTLIHDDLPAMDNSDFRRGKLSCHKKFGEDMAILAGDALNTLAFRIIAEFPSAAKELAGSLLQVVEGQALDINSTGKKLSIKELTAIHNLKTGALLKACVRGAAFIRGASPRQVRSLTAYACHLGLVFQITDDILDATSTKEALGKPVKSDIGKGFPYFLGLEKSKKMAEAELKKALYSLKCFGKEADDLRSIACFVKSRGK